MCIRDRYSRLKKMPYLYDNKDAEFLNQFKLLLTGQYQGAQVSPSGANRFRKGSHGRENEWRRLQIGFEAVFFKNRLTLHSLTNMGELDGMETARRIRERDGGVLIVFITNMAQYAIRGYAVGALDYVLKPVPYFAFSQQLRKAEEQLRRHEEYFADFAWRDKSEQYKRVLREYPQLLQRIALKDLAAYLFLTPQSLSRIRAEIK